MRNTSAYLIPLGCALALTIVTCTKPEEPLEPSFAVSSCVLTLTQAQTNPRTVPANSTWNQASWFIKNTGTGTVSLTGQQLSAVPKPPITAVRLIAWTSFPMSLAPGEQIDAEVAFDVGASGTGSVGLTVKTSCAGDKALPAYSVAVSGSVVLSAIVSAPGSDRAAVMWTTNAASNSSVDYGLSSGYGSTTPVQPASVTAHTVLLTGLVPQKVYHYRVRSGTTVSGDRTFSTSPAGLASFPGAQGSGATGLGGRGGRVIRVTTLADNGPGSLRECMKATGKRICVFRVGGIIDLETNIRVTTGELTVAGQTAPGGGILIRGTRNPANQITVAAPDVVLQYLRIRSRYNPARDPDTSEGGGGVALAFSDNAARVVTDHLSLSWSTNDNVSIWDQPNAGGEPRDLSLSSILVAEAFKGHATALIIGSDSVGPRSSMTNIDVHHSMFSHHTHRVPLLKHKSSRIVNNIMYNSERYATRIVGGARVDLIGNRYKRASRSNAGPPAGMHEVQATTAGGAAGDPLIYLEDNKGWSLPAGDPWAMAAAVDNEISTTEAGAIPQNWRSGQQATAGVPIIADPVNNLEGILTGSLGVGASARLGCDGTWVANRDAVDDRLMREYAAGTGDYPRAPDAVTYPTIAAGVPCDDTDRDGMPDLWESANNLNPTSNLDQNALAANGSGYSNLDMYLAGMRAK